MNFKEIKESQLFLSLGDGASLVAHDIAAQLHVVYFCLEEMRGKLDIEGQRFYEQVKEACEQINNEIVDFRNYLKDINSIEQDLAFASVWQRSYVQLKLFQGKIFKRIQFVIEGNMPEQKVSSSMVLPLNFAVYSVFSMALVEVANEKLMTQFKFNASLIEIKLTAKWKRKWWKSWPDTPLENAHLKGMRARLMGESFFKDLEAQIEEQEMGPMERIPLLVRIKI